MDMGYVSVYKPGVVEGIHPHQERRRRCYATTDTYVHRVITMKWLQVKTIPIKERQEIGPT